jgi:formylglycine-generating enzyme required for sulfatase activity
MHSEYPDEYPIVNVSWRQAQKYCEWAGGSYRAGKVNSSAGRLPTEIEWEYAARAGTKSSRCGHEYRDDLFRFASFGSPRQLKTVASKRPNDWGLYDVLGNVWEWCSDKQDGLRVARGGSYSSNYEQIRVTARQLSRGNGLPDVGFRCLIEDASCLRPVR